MATKTHRWSRADLARMPDDGNRYEVLNGELFVTPQASFPHQWIATRLIVTLTPFVDKHQLGVALGPGAVTFDESELQPDVLVVPPPFSDYPEKWDELSRPILVVEVLSSSTQRRDLHFKPSAYRGIAIPEYWVIDRFERRALVWKGGAKTPDVVTTELRWSPRADLEPLIIPMTEILPPAGKGGS